MDCLILKIKNTSGSKIERLDLILEVDEEKYIFFSSWLLSDSGNYLISCIQDDLITCYDTEALEMTKQDAIDNINFMINFLLKNSCNDETNISSQVVLNIEISKYIIAIVRANMINTSLSELGLSGAALLNKLSGVVGAIQLGMFKEASQLLLSLEFDNYLTSERLNRYSNLVLSADAINYG